MYNKYHDQVKNLAIGEIISVDRRWGYPAVIKLFKDFGYQYEDIHKPEATWARNVRRTA